MIFNFFSIFTKPVTFQTGAPKEKRAEYESELKEQFKFLSGKKNTSSHPEWNENVAKLHDLVQKESLDNFLNWPVIRGTMFHICSRKELAYLKNQPAWHDLFMEALREYEVGNPPPYEYFKSSSGNRIHHLYNIARFAETTGVDISSLRTIIEFGGGYGSTCNLLYALKFTGAYTIYDLPEFSALQKYYLQSTQVIPSHDVSFASDTSTLEKTVNNQNPPDLFIGTWSISEVPLVLRESILETIGKPKCMLIAYQKNFENVDNEEYFARLQKEWGEYEWYTETIEHLGGNMYLFGKKKK